jgi:hypothetical protein
MHWLTIGLGAALVALAAMLKLMGGTSDLQQHALPFWAFIAGITGLFLGGWHRDKAWGGPSPGYATAGHSTLARAVMPALATGAHSTVQGAAMAGTMLATAPAMLPTNSLSSLQRPSTAAAPAMPDDIMARILGLEAENKVLRAFLLEAKANISR